MNTCDTTVTIVKVGHQFVATKTRGDLVTEFKFCACDVEIIGCGPGNTECRPLRPADDILTIQKTNGTYGSFSFDYTQWVVDGQTPISKAHACDLLGDLLNNTTYEYKFAANYLEGIHATSGGKWYLTVNYEEKLGLLDPIGTLPTVGHLIITKGAGFATPVLDDPAFQLNQSPFPFSIVTTGTEAFKVVITVTNTAGGTASLTTYLTVNTTTNTFTETSYKMAMQPTYNATTHALMGDFTASKYGDQATNDATLAIDGVTKLDSGGSALAMPLIDWEVPNPLGGYYADGEIHDVTIAWTSDHASVPAAIDNLTAELVLQVRLTKVVA